MTTSDPSGPGGVQPSRSEPMDIPAALDGVFVAALGTSDAEREHDIGVTGVRLRGGKVLWSRSAALAEVGEAFFCADVPGLDGSAAHAERSLRLALSDTGWPASDTWRPVAAGVSRPAELFVRVRRPGQLDFRPTGLGRAGSRGGTISMGGAHDIVAAFVGQQDIAALARVDADAALEGGGAGYRLGVARLADGAPMRWSGRIERRKPDILNLRTEFEAAVVDCALFDPQRPLGERIERHRFGGVDAASSVTVLEDVRLRWPNVHPEYRKRAYRYLYGVARANDDREAPLLARHDTHTGQSVVLADGFGFGRRLSGPVLVKASGATDDDASCIALVTAFDAMRNESSLVIVDVRTERALPAVILPLPVCASVEVPGAWFPAQRDGRP